MVDGYTLGLAKRNGDAADSWMKYARELEQKLVSAQAGVEAMRAVKDGAIAELGKLDPKNPMLDKANQQKVFDKAYYGYRKP
ncbi:hypothetical protein KZJ38_07115 [Paraburkholderia edwinii]|uniref:Uncharacterized protein n=1 Tax=Paraburkholderia edwinii TaxID=2861782 RepID=A0ABX8USW7_9BURK|nr:hypothetical protein [Paraburkholderia edwinii]QYD70074.1 hypothetical protein KZJ38_07115 [Paraburkholderia edwinii]